MENSKVLVVCALYTGEADTKNPFVWPIVLVAVLTGSCCSSFFNINRNYNKILACDWFSARLFAS